MKKIICLIIFFYPFYVLAQQATKAAVSAGCFKCDAIKVSGPDIVNMGQQVTFSAVANGCNYAKPESKFKWDFGDQSALSSSPNHIYTTPGIYTVRCFVANSSTACDESFGLTKVIVNGCTNCNVFDFYYSDNLCAKEELTFVKAIENCNVTILGADIRWDYGDGTPITTDSTHVYASDGSYTVIMLTDNCIMAKPIKINDCSDVFSCEPSNSSDAITCRDFQILAASTFSISATGNPTPNQVEYTILSASASFNPSQYNFLWSLQVPVPNGVSIVGATNGQKVIIEKSNPAAQSPIIKVQICLNSLAGCCYILEINPCRFFKPDIVVSSPITHNHSNSPISASSCSANFQVNIVGGTPGASYDYTWSSDVSSPFVSYPNGGPAGSTTTAAVTHQMKVVFTVVVKERNNNVCGGTASYVVHPPIVDDDGDPQ